MRCRHSKRRYNCQPNESNLGSPLREICSAGSARGDGHKRPGRKPRPYPPLFCIRLSFRGVKAKRKKRNLQSVRDKQVLYLLARSTVRNGKHKVPIETIQPPLVVALLQLPTLAPDRRLSPLHSQSRQKAEQVAR